MYAFVVFMGLALALTVVRDVLVEVLPVKALTSKQAHALTHTIAVAIGIGVAWALDWSVFTAFGQSLRETWMNPVATGVILVGTGEFLRAIAGSVGINLSIGSGSHKTA